MEHKSLHVCIPIVILIIIVWTVWSFRLYKNKSNPTTGSVHYRNNKWLVYRGSHVFNTGVCVLGKLGGILIVLNMVLLYLHFHWKTPSFHDMLLFSTTTTIVTLILALLTNMPLFVRCVPLAVCSNILQIMGTLYKHHCGYDPHVG